MNFLEANALHFIEGKVSFNNRSLHAIGDTPNPYEKAISVIGKTLATFDEDNLIPCFGFGDGRVSILQFLTVFFFFKLSFSFHLIISNYISSIYSLLFVIIVTTHDQEVFSFQSDNLPCHGFEEVLACYRKIVPVLRMSGWFLLSFKSSNFVAHLYLILKLLLPFNLVLLLLILLLF